MQPTRRSPSVLSPPAPGMLSSSGSAKAPALLAPSRSGVAPVPLRRPRRKLIPARSQSGQHAGGSFDSSEDLDYNLAQELDAVAQPDKYAAVAKHLNLLYDASEVRTRQRCGAGRGCNFERGAAGAGACVRPPLQQIYLPRVLWLQRNKVEPCLPCRGSGEQECDWCHGTGECGQRGRQCSASAASL